MQVSNPIQFNSIKIGDLLCRLAGQDVEIVGRVVNIATNRRGIEWRCLIVRGTTTG